MVNNIVSVGKKCNTGLVEALVNLMQHTSSIWAFPRPEKERPRAATYRAKFYKDISPSLYGYAREIGESIFPIFLQDPDVIQLPLQ